jgi:hypothetical protein
MIHESTMGDVPGRRNMHTPGSKEAHCSAAFVQTFVKSLKPRDESYKKKILWTHLGEEEQIMQ